MITILVWCERLLGLAMIFQTLELLRLKPVWANSGVWRWEIVRKDYLSLHPNVLKILDFCLNEENFHRLLKLRMFCAVAVWFIHPALFIAVLFFSTWLIAIRWRGIFNGGSDSMTALIALSLLIAQIFDETPMIQKACFAYIAVQITASYFIAGVVKFKNQDWKMGTALSQFFRMPRYDSPPAWVRAIADHQKYAKVVSWSVIIFELSFPLIWFVPSLALPYLLLGFSFHVINFWIFGLNRFVFAWLAGYPAVYFWTQRAGFFD